MSKPLYQYMFDMLDFADEIIKRIQPNELDNGNYFMTLVYIEDVLDKYGRGMILQSGVDEGKDGHELMKQASYRLESLRKNIRELSENHNFDEVLECRGEDMIRNWSTRPKSL